MGKLGFTKKKGTLAAKIKTVNAAGGVAYRPTNAIQRLIGAIASYKAEPMFYKDKVKSSVTVSYNKEALDQTGCDLVDTAIEVAKGKTPEDLLVVANWCRNDMHMRLAPQILLAVAGRFIKGSPELENPVVRYTPAICARPDDSLQVLALYNLLFSTKTVPYAKSKLPKSLQKGLSAALNSYSHKAILKYHSNTNSPGFKDLLLARARSPIPKNKSAEKGYPISRGLYKYILTGELAEDSPRILRKKTSFHKLDKNKTPLNSGVLQLARDSGLTWENVVSHFGATTDKTRLRKVWELALGNMGYMAKLRNLRNFIEKGLTNKAIVKVSETIADVNEVAKGKQLPYRYLAAYREIEKVQQTNFGKGTKSEVLDNLSLALDNSIVNLPKFDGPSAVFVDISGSMMNPVAGKSAISCKDAASVLGAIIYKQTKGSIIAGVTAQVHEIVNVSPRDTTLSIVNQLEGLGNIPCWTHLDAAITWLQTNKINVNRIILLTDMQTYGRDVSKCIDRYRVGGNQDTFFHTINVQASQDFMTPMTNSKDNVVSGFSEKLIPLMIGHEERVNGKRVMSGPVVTKKAKVVPTMLELRKQYQIDRIQV